MAPPGRWHVLGAGSIGCLVAFHLRTANLPVTLLLRRFPTLYNDAKQTRIRVTSLSDSKEEKLDPPEEGSVDVDFEVLTPLSMDGTGGGGEPSRTSEEEEEEPITRMIVTTKASQAVEAFSRVRGRLGRDSVVVLLTNGWGVREELAERFSFPDERSPGFVLGITTHGCYRRGPLNVVHAGRGRIWFGGAAGSESTVSSSATGRVLGELSDALSSLGVTSPVSEAEVVRLMLSKLAVNACINPLTALFGIRNGELGKHPICRFVLPRLAGEVVSAIGDYCRGTERETSTSPAAAALKSPRDLLDQVEMVATLTARNFSSMHQDLRSSSWRPPAGKPPRVVTECDHILGKIIEMGVARRWMPWCRIVYASVKVAEFWVNLRRYWTWLRSRFWRRIASRKVESG